MIFIVLFIHSIVHWSSIMPQDAVLIRRCCIDGSGMEPQEARLCRAGWAMCHIDEGGGVVAETYGALPGFFRRSGRGELFAFLMLLRGSVPPLTVVTASSHGRHPEPRPPLGPGGGQQRWLGGSVSVRGTVCPEDHQAFHLGQTILAEAAPCFYPETDLRK